MSKYSERKKRIIEKFNSKPLNLRIMLMYMFEYEDPRTNAYVLNDQLQMTNKTLIHTNKSRLLWIDDLLTILEKYEPCVDLHREPNDIVEFHVLQLHSEIPENHI